MVIGSHNHTILVSCRMANRNYSYFRISSTDHLTKYSSHIISALNVCSNYSVLHQNQPSKSPIQILFVVITTTSSTSALWLLYRAFRVIRMSKKRISDSAGMLTTPSNSFAFRNLLYSQQFNS